MGITQLTKADPTAMTIWKPIISIVTVLLMTVGPARADRHTPSLPLPKMGDNGMYAQEWLYKSSLNLRTDLSATRKEGKRFVILWEQKDCLYCQPTYEVNLRIPRVIEKIKKNFNVVKLDIMGNRKFTDLDGTVRTEGELAAKYKVQYTPTYQFLPESLEKAAGKPVGDLDSFRFQGHFKPFHFYFMFHYVQAKGYEFEPSFQRWLGNIGKDMQAKGIKYELWVDHLPPNLPDQY